MSAELAPRKQIEPFVAALYEIAGAGEKPNEVHHKTKSLWDLDLGALYDPRLAAGRMMLILQEKGQNAQIGKRTVRVELFANRFRAISYITESTVQGELHKQIIDIKAQEEPLDYEKGYGQLVETFDDLDPRLDEAKQRIGDTEKAPTTKDLSDIRKGLQALTTGRLEYENWGSRKLLKFFNRQFE